ncbi:hypothetical protein SDC9_96545 [bioreactor metagenome]|uniref:ABC transporter domain-containing protein n=1 Tax=bioreactor metagenome TaxID=1076179 RepID=A0A645AJI1_9ZZZZ
MLKRKMHAIKSMKRRIDKLEVNHAPDPEEAINIYFAAVDLPEDRLVLNLDLPQLAINGQLLSQQLRLIVRGPRHIVIVGDNGTGKTTLLKTIYTQLQDSSLSIAYMAQDYEEIMDAALNPLEYLEVVGQRAEEIKLRQFLGNLKFTVTEMEQPIANLSGGQKAKLALLKLVYQNPQVLLLDEPSRNLSPLSNPVIRQMLSDYQGCIIAISHDRMFIRQLADEVYELTANGLSRLYNWAD